MFHDYVYGDKQGALIPIPSWHPALYVKQDFSETRSRTYLAVKWPARAVYRENARFMPNVKVVTPRRDAAREIYAG
jgi:hypothetical protein